MDITINGTEKEIAAILLAVEERHKSNKDENLHIFIFRQGEKDKYELSPKNQ